MHFFSELSERQKIDCKHGRNRYPRFLLPAGCNTYITMQSILGIYRTDMFMFFKIFLYGMKVFNLTKTSSCMLILNPSCFCEKG